MVALGLFVGRGSTPMDDWFHRHGRDVRLLTYLVSPWVLAAVVIATVAAAVYQRRQRLAIAAALCPLLAMALARVLKPLFGRVRGPAFAYPSGHAATLVTVMGMVVLVAGAALWVVLIVVAYCLLGMLGVGSTFHYFTDTVGGLLLGTSIVCVAALVLGHVPRRT